jgi:hypothetical protein
MRKLKTWVQLHMRDLSKDKVLAASGRALTTLFGALFSAIPMLVLGWLIAAIGRHPETAAALDSEMAVKVLVAWSGGWNGAAPAAIVSLAVLSSLVGIGALASGRFSNDDPTDAKAAKVLRLLGIGIVGPLAFLCGAVTENSWSSLLWSVGMSAAFGVLSWIALVIAELVAGGSQKVR